MKSTPLLSDVDLSKPRFRDGDRVIVRVSSDMRADQKAKMAKSVAKFANAHIRVWIINVLRAHVELIRGDTTEVLAGLVHVEPKAGAVKPGVMNVSLGVVEFAPNDILRVRTKRLEADQIKQMKSALKEWAGTDIDVQIISDVGMFV